MSSTEIENAARLFPEFDPRRFGEEEARRRLDDLDRLERIFAESELTDEDAEALDGILKEGIRQRHVEFMSGVKKLGMERI